MKRWKDGKNRYELHLDDSGKDSGVLYFDERYGVFTFRVFIGSGSEEVDLSAKSLHDAKIESEKYLRDILQDQIRLYEGCISIYKKRLKLLEE